MRLCFLSYNMLHLRPFKQNIQCAIRGPILHYVNELTTQRRDLKMDNRCANLALKIFGLCPAKLCVLQNTNLTFSENILKVYCFIFCPSQSNKSSTIYINNLYHNLNNAITQYLLCISGIVQVSHSIISLDIRQTPLCMLNNLQLRNMAILY